MLSCPVMWHEQQFEKMERLATFVSEEVGSCGVLGSWHDQIGVKMVGACFMNSLCNDGCVCALYQKDYST